MSAWDKLKRWLRFNLLYFGRPVWDTGISPPELIELLDRMPPGSALDIGCGTGTNLLTMAERGWQVTGLDFAWLSVLKAKLKLRRAGVGARVLRRDVTETVVLDRSFDLVLDMGCFHGLSADGRLRYRENLNRWLRRGGKFLLYAHKRRSPQSNYGVDELDLWAFRSFLELKWRADNDEEHPDGSGGFPTLWVMFHKPDQTKV